MRVVKLALYQVDAFTNRPFAGNPAGGVPARTRLAGSARLRRQWRIPQGSEIDRPE